MLCITLQKLFTVDFDASVPLIQAIRRNIFDMISLIREAAYDVFDPTHSLKVTYLLFLVHKPIGDPNMDF